jgi:hypothetical protein
MIRFQRHRVLASLLAVFASISLLHCTERAIPQQSGEGPSGPDGPLPSAAPSTDDLDSGASPSQVEPAAKDGGTERAADAGFDSGWQPPENFTGLGSTVQACNGNGLVAQYGPDEPTQTWNVRTVWVFGNDPVSGRGNTIFGYTRPLIEHSTLPLKGTSGEMQVRLAINAPNPTLTPGAQYQGMVAVSTWNAAEAKWTTVAGSMTGAALVFIDTFSADATAWSDGHLCAGKITGRVESLVGGATRLDFRFAAPLLAPSSFPK